VPIGVAGGPPDPTSGLVRYGSRDYAPRVMDRRRPPGPGP